LWTVLFRAGSTLVPLFFGHLAAALYRGQLLASPTTVWESYFAPWLGFFPLCTGLFTVSLFAWLASVFLLGEMEEGARVQWMHRVRGWTVAMLVCGCAVSVAAWLEGVELLRQAHMDPGVLWALGLASAGLIPFLAGVGVHRVWLGRGIAGAVVGFVLLGYFGAGYPVAVQYAGGEALLWPQSQAPEATLRALSLTLVLSSLVIFPGLGWLYSIFKGRVDVG
jgi:cytochrome d ubiquinol oxidase subunit II